MTTLRPVGTSVRSGSACGSSNPRLAAGRGRHSPGTSQSRLAFVSTNAQVQSVGYEPGQGPHSRGAVSGFGSYAGGMPRFLQGTGGLGGVTGGGGGGAMAR